MLNKADVYVVFEDFSSDELIGEWQVDFQATEGLGSKQSLTDYLIKQYAKKGRKVLYLSIWKNKEEVY